MTIMDEINNIRENQEKIIQSNTTKGIPANIKDISQKCARTNKNELLEIKSFNNFIFFNKKATFLQNSSIEKVHATTLFMSNPKVFDFLMKNNPYYKEAVIQQQHINRASNVFYNPINIPEIEKHSRELLKTYIETQTPIKFSLYANIDDLSSLCDFWEKTKINYFQMIIEKQGASFNSELKHSYDTSYLDWAEKKYIHKDISNFISFEISRKLDNDDDFNKNIKGFIKQVETLKTLLGDASLTYTSEVFDTKGQMNFQLSQRSALSIIDEELMKTPHIYNYISVYLDKKSIEEHINKQPTVPIMEEPVFNEFKI